MQEINNKLKGFIQLETPRLILRRLQKSDVADMYEYARIPEVTEYLLWEAHPDIEYTASYIASVQRYYKNGQYFDYAVILKEEDKMIGTCGFARVDDLNRCGEIGYVLNPAYRGRGYASEAARALMKMGFTELGLHRIEARYMVKNTASRRVMERCGMTFEGVHRGMMLVRGRFEDIGICSAMAGEFLEKYGNDDSRALFRRSLFFSLYG